VSDLEKRRFERLGAEGDLPSRVRSLATRLRDGTLLRSRLELAALCGDEAALELVDPAAREFLSASGVNPADPDVGRWLRFVAEVASPAVTVRAVLLAARIACLPGALEAGRWLDDTSRPLTESLPDRGLRSCLSSALGRRPTGLLFPPHLGGPYVNDVIARTGKLELYRELRRELIAFALDTEKPLFGVFGLRVMEDLKTRPLLATYRARASANDEAVVVEGPCFSLRPEALDHPSRARELDHPHLARIVHIHTARGDHYDDTIGLAIVSARADGVELADWLGGGPTFEDKLALISKLATGLEHAHAREVFHGRLSARSVRVERGEPRIVDLALAQLDVFRDGGTNAVPSLFPPGVGIAPELLNASAPIGAASDVYGLATLAFEVIEGRPIFEPTGTLQGDVHAALQAPPPVAAFKPLVFERALSKRPQVRFPSVAAFRAALLGS
jgi:hypothetical protein